jgi:hypothetical protein
MYLGEYEYQGERLPASDCFWLARLGLGTLVLDPPNRRSSPGFRWSTRRIGVHTMNRAPPGRGGMFGGDKAREICRRESPNPE